MERECQEECVLIHFDLLRETIDRYLKKHSFCDECTKMVNKAYKMLIEDSDEREELEETSTNSSYKFPQENCQDKEKVKKIYNGLTVCVSDQHVHVECKEEVVSNLIEMAEPELTGLKQERHAKTIEIAQKEVLTCIGKKFFLRLELSNKLCDDYRNVSVRKVPTYPTKAKRRPASLRLAVLLRTAKFETFF